MKIRSRVSLFCGAIAGPLFTLAYLAEGATRAGYDPLRHPVSSLALGEYGWMQTLNFFVAAALTIVFAAGMQHLSTRSTWKPLLIGLWGSALLGAGIFVTDPVGGYPAGTSDRIPSATTHGALHDYVSLTGFAMLTAACFAFARQGTARWRLYCVLSGVGFAVTMLGSSAAFGQTGELGDVAGLFQRIALTTAWSWQTILALRLLSRSRRGETGRDG
ncbi:DUF998 domain-containing protein [Spirillospora sp. NPDC048824]|uniref:DUF998 domain-containing protein n=1 Tax=Spirillospora sp. NPDC048824 TaxID=3364526 RepID=UPI003715B733